MEEALKLLDEIEENANVCCGVTLDPDDLLELIDKLRKILKEQQWKNTSTEEN